MAKKFISTSAISTLFGVTTGTVNNWRRGSKRIAPLPYHTEDREVLHRVMFKPQEVLNWARKQGMETVVDMDTVCGDVE